MISYSLILPTSIGILGYLAIKIFRWKYHKFGFGPSKNGYRLFIAVLLGFNIGLFIDCYQFLSNK